MAINQKKKNHFLSTFNFYNNQNQKKVSETTNRKYKNKNGENYYILAVNNLTKDFFILLFQ